MEATKHLKVLQVVLEWKSRGQFLMGGIADGGIINPSMGYNSPLLETRVVGWNHQLHCDRDSSNVISAWVNKWYCLKFYKWYQSRRHILFLVERIVNGEIVSLNMCNNYS